MMKFWPPFSMIIFSLSPLGSMAEDLSVSEQFLDKIRDCQTLLIPSNTRQYEVVSLDDSPPVVEFDQEDSYFLKQSYSTEKGPADFHYLASIDGDVLKQSIFFVDHEYRTRSELNPSHYLGKALELLNVDYVNYVLGDWFEGNEHSFFFRNLALGKTAGEAAQRTVTGRMLRPHGYTQVQHLDIGLNRYFVKKKNKNPKVVATADDYTVYAYFSNPTELPSQTRFTRNGPLRAVWNPAENIVRIDDIMFDFHLDLEFVDGHIDILPSSVLQIEEFHSEYLEGVSEYIQFLNEIASPSSMRTNFKYEIEGRLVKGIDHLAQIIPGTTVADFKNSVLGEAANHLGVNINAVLVFHDQIAVVMERER